jgi:hypothetical protein
VGSQGIVEANSVMGGNGVALQGNNSDPGPTDYLLFNAGDIFGGYAGVELAGGGDDSIINSGDISGATGIVVTGTIATEYIENSGTISGSLNSLNAGAAIWCYGSPAARSVDIVNSGIIANTGANPAGDGGALFFHDASGTTSIIDNKGTIIGSGYAIQSLTDILDIANSGTIQGGLYSKSAVDVDNSGLWQGQAGANYGWELEAAGDTITNAGMIEAAISLIAGDDTVSNSGTTTKGILLTGAGEENNLDNSGTIAGAVLWVGGGDTITNSGVVESYVDVLGSHGYDYVKNEGSIGQIYFEPADETLINTQTGAIGGQATFEGAGDTLDNSGRIDGAVTLLGGGDTVTNAGDIDGLVEFTGSGATNSLANSGSITGGLKFSGQGTTLTNAQAGTITGPVSFGNADDTVDNSGAIDGKLTIASGGDTVTNAGDIDGAVSFTGTGATNSLTNSGSITGAVGFNAEYIQFTNTQAGTIGGYLNFNGSGDTIDNAGKIDGTVAIESGGDAFNNAGDIDGLVEFGGPGVNNTFTNSGSIREGFDYLSSKDSVVTNNGQIYGNVQLGGSDTLTNHSQIYGNVGLGATNTLTNDGTIHGNVALGATDTFDVSPGEVTGSITASTSDLFEFSGNFSNETINGFTGGTGSTHDTIQFAANDFASFAALQKDMTQAGSDVLIRLDSTDSITLTGVTLSSLVAADFKFV